MPRIKGPGGSVSFLNLPAKREAEHRMHHYTNTKHILVVAAFLCVSYPEFLCSKRNLRRLFAKEAECHIHYIILNLCSHFLHTLQEAGCFSSKSNIATKHILVVATCLSICYAELVRSEIGEPKNEEKIIENRHLQNNYSIPCTTSY